MPSLSASEIVALTDERLSGKGGSSQRLRSVAGAFSRLVGFPPLIDAQPGGLVSGRFRLARTADHLAIGELDGP